jgi:hypothetical protein
LLWCPGSFLGGAFDVTTLEGSVAEAVFPARLPRNSSTLACTSTLHGGASDDDEDGVLVLVFIVAVLLVSAADAILSMDALLGENLVFSVIPYFSLTFSSFLATADDDVDTPEDKPAVVVVADAVLDILALAVAELAGLAVTDGKGDSTGDEFKAATVVVFVFVRGGGGNASGSGNASGNASGIGSGNASGSGSVSGSFVVADAVVTVVAMVGVFGIVFIFVVTGEALALALAVAEFLGEVVTDFKDGDFFAGDFTALVLVDLGF